MQMPLGGLSGKPIFDEFDEKAYAAMLSLFLNIPEETLSPAPGVTWIGDLRKPRTIDVNEYPFG